MVLGAISGQENIWFRLAEPKTKECCRATCGNFRTVGPQVEIRLRSLSRKHSRQWMAVDRPWTSKANYTEMDRALRPMSACKRSWPHFGKKPRGRRGLSRSTIPASLHHDRESNSSRSTLVLADFRRASVIAKDPAKPRLRAQCAAGMHQHLESGPKNPRAEAEGRAALLDPVSPTGGGPSQRVRALKDGRRAGRRAAETSHLSGG